MKRMFSGPFNWRYAIGEVLLIVLGILIALGIDSLAGARADERQVAGYLEDVAPNG